MRGKKVKYLKRLRAHLIEQGIFQEDNTLRNFKKVYMTFNWIKRSKYR